LKGEGETQRKGEKEKRRKGEEEKRRSGELSIAEIIWFHCS